MKKRTGTVVAALVAGLFMAGHVMAADEAAGTAKSTDVKCSGVNECKSKGACKSADNACKGQNGCKGKGWVTMSDKDCVAKGGKVVKE